MTSNFKQLLEGDGCYSAALRLKQDCKARAPKAAELMIAEATIPSVWNLLKTSSCWGLKLTMTEPLCPTWRKKPAKQLR